MTFTFDINAYVDQNAARVRDDLRRYYADPADPNDGFTGRHFDRLSAESDPTRFTPHDVAGLATLGVELSGRAVSQLFFDNADDLHARLQRCPDPAAALWEVDEAEISAGSELAGLYDALKQLDQVGYVRASKLLSSKRPRLVPIRDRVVESLLGAQESWWGPMRSAFTSRDLAGRLREIADGVVPDYVSELRLLDVALWMEGKRRKAAR